jgi:hypothetical protein
MPGNAWGYAKFAVLILLGGVCVWLVYRNLLSAPEPAVATSPPVVGGAGNRSRAQREEETQSRNRQRLSNLDPTLRLDVLEAARAVKYAGGSRNIFQVFTPPPPPPPIPPTPDPSIEPITPVPPTPAPTAIPLKFYGVAQRPGDSQKKAFLTGSEDEIFIGRVGDVVAKFYRIILIGVNAIELEDTRSQERQQLPLLME